MSTVGIVSEQFRGSVAADKTSREYERCRRRCGPPYLARPYLYYVSTFSNNI